jgi:type VI secretion system protein ImpK
MAERRQNSYQLLRQFREFYVELAKLRHLVELDPEQGQGELSASNAVPDSNSATGESAATAALAALPVDKVTDDVWGEMARYLDEKMYKVRMASSSLSHDIMEELVYIMAAFADETFVCMLSWSGRDYWRDHLMELRLFHSQIAGQSVFERIDRLLMRSDYGSEELSAVYLMVLSLGFRGRYQMNPDAVDGYRKRLFDRLHLSDSTFVKSGYRMFPDAYQHTVTDGSPVRLAEPRKWWGVVATIVILWLIASTAAWFALASPLNTDLHVTQQLLNAVQSEFLKEDTTTGTNYAFTILNGQFQLTLPKDLPVIQKAAGASIAPFFVRVQTNGSSSPTDIQTWLSTGMTQVATAGSQQTQPVLLAESVPSPHGVKSVASTFYFLVDPGLAAADIKKGAVLKLPSEMPAGVSAVSLYLPERNKGAAQ